VTSTNHDTEVLERTGPPAPPADLTEAIEAAAPRRWWNRTTIGLLGLVLLAAGFLGGVQVHQRWGTSPSATGLPGEAGMPSGLPGGARPDASAAAAPAAGTAGTVKLVDSRTLYLETPAGETITVRTTDLTVVRMMQTATLAGLLAGQHVVVEGAPDSEGIINATTVTAQ
jgi:hypothetical protein